MEILIYSSRFYPQVGGTETVVKLLAASFVENGHKVNVITGGGNEDAMSDSLFPFPIFRSPGFVRHFYLARKASIILHNSIGLKTLLVDLFFLRKLVVIHHTWYSGLSGALKKVVARRFQNIYVSHALQSHVGAKGIIIGNPYDSKIFKRLPDVTKKKDIVFLGRLISEKGCALLIQATQKLKDSNFKVNLTVIGDGFERESLLRLRSELGLNDDVHFVGLKFNQELASLLNEHKIMVVPSLWNEPFGIVALEGMACGCFVIGSDEGGLKDAIGQAGLTFKNGDLNDLVRCLGLALRNDNEILQREQYIPQHLMNYSETVIAKKYLNFFESMFQW